MRGSVSGADLDDVVGPRAGGLDVGLDDVVVGAVTVAVQVELAAVAVEDHVWQEIDEADVVAGAGLVELAVGPGCDMDRVGHGVGAAAGGRQEGVAAAQAVATPSTPDFPAERPWKR